MISIVFGVFLKKALCPEKELGPLATGRGETPAPQRHYLYGSGAKFKFTPDLAGE
jgi:hypothetical protein